MNEQNTKECHYCHEIKTLDQFNKSNHCKFGVTNMCKECAKLYRIKNKEHKKSYMKIWRKSNLERCRKNNLDHYYKNKEHLAKKSKEWKRKKRKEDPNYFKEKYQQNKEKHKIWSKTWRENNKEYFREYNRQYNKNVRKYNINDRIAHRIRRRIRNEIKQARGIKLVSTSGLVGCSWDDLMQHLESQFYDKILPNGEIIEMSWNNYGYGDKKWHLDHFLPCCSFDLSKIENQHKCFHYSNLRPLWQNENCEKSAQDKKIKYQKT